MAHMAHQIEVTVEKTYRVCGVTTVSDEEYDAITKDGETPHLVDDLLTKILDLDFASDSSDYAVWDLDNQKQIVDWDD